MRFFGHTNIKATKKYKRSIDFKTRKESTKNIEKKVVQIIAQSKNKKKKR